MNKIFSFLVVVLAFNVASSQVSIPNSSFTYAQTFATNAVPAGWSFFETGTGANTAFATGTGTASAGDTYFLGTSGSYAFGGLQSGSVTPTVGVCFTNNSPNVLNSMTINFTAETWRVGAANRPDGLNFEYKVNALQLNETGYTAVPSLNYSYQQAAIGNGSALNTGILSNTLTALNLQPGENICFRWIDPNATGSDDAVGIGEFNVTQVVLPINLIDYKVSTQNKNTNIQWSTATEINNSHFNIEHSLDGRNFDIVGEIKGAGTSTTIKDYTFIHENVPSGVNYYRLTQVDYDGKSETFEVKSVKVEGEKTFRAFPSETTDFLNIELNTDFPVILYDAMGKEQMKIKTSDKINISNLVNGIYFLKSGNETIKIRKI
jgi:hypothetical protein